MAVEYRCHFTFRRFDSKSVIVTSISDIKNGFWVNYCGEKYEGRLDTGDNCCFWIAPGAIRYVEKIGNRSK